MNVIEERIDGTRVIISEMPATRSTILFAKIIKYFGSGVITAISGLKDIMQDKELTLQQLLSEDINFSTFVDAINDISAKLEPEMFLTLVQEIVTGSRIQHPTNAGEMIEVNTTTFDAVFTGRIMLMYKVVFLNLKVNFGSFLVGGGNGITPAVSVSPVPNKKTK